MRQYWGWSPFDRDKIKQRKPKHGKALIALNKAAQEIRKRPQTIEADWERRDDHWKRAHAPPIKR